MAEFYAYRIISGKTTYSKVPAKLKEKVKTILVDEGLTELVKE